MLLLHLRGQRLTCLSRKAVLLSQHRRVKSTKEEPTDKRYAKVAMASSH